MPTIDELVLDRLTSTALLTHLQSQGWTANGAVAHPECGALIVMIRVRSDGSVDHTAVPTDPGRQLLLAQTLAASVARDGLDMASVVADLGL